MAPRTKLPQRRRTANRKFSAPFGSPPLIEGEDPAAYEEVLRRVSDALKPNDFIETIFVQDVAESTWEALRMRRFKAHLLTSFMPGELAGVLEPIMYGERKLAIELAQQWAIRHAEGVKEVNNLLTSAKTTLEHVAARTLSANIDSVERIDRMIVNAEARRHAALHELERHRAALAKVPRVANDDVVDAEFEDIDPATCQQSDAA
jgi:hypothetical protein